jgi:glycosyltransferase involved in cell wall biosynthesis
MDNNDQKKILVKHNLTVVCGYFYPKVGGLETIAYTTAKMLHESGKYNVSIITSDYANTGKRKEVIDGMNVYRLPIMFMLSNSPINPLWYFMMKDILKAEKTEILHTHSPVPFMADLAVFVAKMSKIPVVSTYHSGSMKKGSLIYDPIIYIYENYFLRKMFKMADVVVTVHQAFMLKNYPEFKNKTKFIPTGVDLNRFKYSEINRETKIVSFIGRVELSSKWKGIDQLILAMKMVKDKVPDAKLMIVGGGDALDYYKKISIENEVESLVELVGPKFGDDLVDIYKKSRVIVLPSTSDSEAFSVTLVESMASGRPIIGTNIGGTPQVIKNGQNGILVEPKDSKALADSIVKVLADYDYSKKLGDNGYTIAKNFSWETQTLKYDQIFSGLLE